jgi:hypothetical protein
VGMRRHRINTGCDEFDDIVELITHLARYTPGTGTATTQRVTWQAVDMVGGKWRYQHFWPRSDR